MAFGNANRPLRRPTGCSEPQNKQRQATGNGLPSGTVTVAASTGETCTGILSASAGSCSFTFVTVGSRTLTATYLGDSFTGSVSAGVMQSVNGPLASLSPASVNFGNVYLGLPAVQTVTLLNIGNASMSVGSVKVSGAMIVTTLPHSAYAPRAYRQARVA